MRILYFIIALTFAEHCRARPFLLHDAEIVQAKTQIGDWILETARDPFSESQTCRLRAADHRAFYANGAVAFRLHARRDQRGAVYRLDDAAPRYVRDDLPQLLALQVPIDRGGMDNASKGLVWIPYDRLVEADKITIKLQHSNKLWEFRFRGLQLLYDIAQARGCTPDSRFVER